jgi:glutaminyl-peptide cyclotransferase
MNRTISILSFLTLLSACNNPSGNNSGTGSGGDKVADNTPPVINYSVIRTLPHDTSSFTEGLLVHEGQLYESTGTEPDFAEDRRSLFGAVDSITGKIHVKAELDRKKFFGEGIVFLKDKIYQLTWKTKTGFIYDAKTFKKLGEFTFPSEEGWGMTTDGNSLIMSDGSSNIYYLDPTKTQPVSVSIKYADSNAEQKTLNTFRMVKILGVSDNNGPNGNINELELINGFLYANQWETNYILKIDTASGKVVGKLDLETLHDDAKNKFSGLQEMNGIAFDPATNKIFVTGKLWKNIYEISFPH